MAGEWSVFRFSEGLGLVSMIGTAGGLCAFGYGVYMFAYRHYEKYKREKVVSSGPSNVVSTMFMLDMSDIPSPTPISQI